VLIAKNRATKDNVSSLGQLRGPVNPGPRPARPGPTSPRGNARVGL